MKKPLSLVCALFALNMASWAAPVDEEAARNIAAGFTANVPSLRLGGQAGTSFTTAYSPMTDDGRTAFYVFNRGRAGGFVIVSGDDRAEPVLGYADRGTFHIDSIPPAMRWWLGQYADAIAALPDGLQKLPSLPGAQQLKPASEQAAPAPAVRLRQTRATGEVPPLLGDIEWGQDEPYSLLCPVLEDEYGGKRRSPSGCVATAAAQIMYYWKHPLQGTGSHNYVLSYDGRTLSADFGSTRYDWDNMLPNYIQGYTTAQGNAVATLMYHCGVAANMEYGPSESGTSELYMAKALFNHFDYDKSITYCFRPSYTSKEWTALVRAELDAARPVLYCGNAPEGAHAFVCDGYRGNGYFHINWGWDGYCNGYFHLDALEPEVQGTGGYEGGYNDAQTIVIGIRPNQGGMPEARLLSTGMKPLADVISKNGGELSFEVNHVGLQNAFYEKISLDFGLLMYDESGELVKSLPYAGRPLYEYVPGGLYMPFLIEPMKIAFPADLPDGSYELVFAYANYTESSVPTLQPVIVPDNLPPVMASVEGDKVYISGGRDSETTAKTIELKAIRSGSDIPATATKGEAFAATALLQNDGNTDYTGEIVLYYLDAKGNPVHYSTPTTHTVPAGSQQATIPLTDHPADVLPNGHYQATFAYRDECGYLERIPFDEGGDFFTLEVQNSDVTDPDAPEVHLVEASTQLPETIGASGSFTASTIVKNNGTATFSAQVLLAMLDIEQTKLLYNTQPKQVNVPAGSTASAQFTGDLAGKVPAGDYIWVIATLDDKYLGDFLPLENGETTFPVTVQAGGTTVDPTEPELTLVENETEFLTSFAQSTDYGISVTLHNGGAGFTGEVYALLWDGKSTLYHRQAIPVTLQQGQKAKFDYTWNVGNVATGRYVFSYARLVGDTYHFIPFDDANGTTAFYVNVVNNAEAPKLNLAQESTVIPAIFYQNTDFTISTVVRNTGKGNFSGEVSFMLMDNEGYVKYYTQPYLSLDVPAGNSVPLTITGNVGNLATGGYLAGIATIENRTPTLIYYEDGKNVTEVKVQAAPSGLTATQADAPGKAQKIFRDGQILIIRNGKVYNLNGQEMGKEW